MTVWTGSKSLVHEAKTCAMEDNHLKWKWSWSRSCCSICTILLYDLLYDLVDCAIFQLKILSYLAALGWIIESVCEQPNVYITWHSKIQKCSYFKSLHFLFVASFALGLIPAWISRVLHITFNVATSSAWRSIVVLGGRSTRYDIDLEDPWDRRIDLCISRTFLKTEKLTLE